MKIMKYLVLAFMAFSLLSCEDDKINYRQPGESVPIDIEREPGMNVVGRVTVDGRPRAGVVVSDGVNVVATNDKGEYQMQSLDRQHVFVSVPADCQVPVEGGFCKFYKTIDLSQDAAIQLNFDLASAPVKTDFTLLTLADVQIGTDTDISMLDDILANTGWKNYVASLTGNMIGISLGDICWNAPAHYSTYRNRIAQLGVPMLSVIGNHDHDKGGTGDITTDKSYRDAMGPTYYSLNIGDWHIVALDDVLYTSHSDYAATITDQQMAWLKEDLKYVDKSKSILIGLHIPTIRRNSSGHVTNNHELYDLVKDYHQVQILSGHLHNNQHYDVASNIRESSIGAVMGAWWNGMICNDGSPRGYALLNMSGNKVVNNKYYGCDTPEDYQIKIYLPAEATFRAGRVPGTIASPADAQPRIRDDETLLINVFYWHTDWTVEVQVDGGSWTPIHPVRNILDPRAVRELEYSNSWEQRPTSEPEKNCDHMFLYKPANKNWRTLNVRATDGYGNNYNASVNNE